jgi:hypothetical protein
MTTYLYTKLNQYFERDADINKVIRYIKNGTFPSDVDTKIKENKFKRKFKNFKVIDNKLVYEPKNLTVIPKRSTNKTLKDEYKENFGSGIINFYKTIRSKYLNIKREDVEEFIKKQVNNQLIGDFKHRTNKPIVSMYPNQVWCLDCIDVEKYGTRNRNNNFILNVIDVFSRKFWLEPMKKQTSLLTKNALMRIINRAGVSPKYLISDNGTEFHKEFEKYCDTNNIKQRFNRAYAPQANGIVERANKEVRKLMKHIFIQHGNNVWINDIDTIEDNHNNTYTSAIKNIPNKIWTNTNEPAANIIINTPEQQQQHDAKNEILKNVKRKIKEFKENEFEVGDSVRLRMDEIFKNVKQAVKKGETKKLIVTYAPSIFKIIKKIVPKRGLLERSRYILEANNGKPLLTKTGGKPRQVYANVLLKVNEKDYADISNADALKINGLQPNENDATT